MQAPPWRCLQATHGNLDAADIGNGEQALQRFSVSLMTRLCDESRMTQAGPACSVQLGFR